MDKFLTAQSFLDDALRRADGEYITDIYLSLGEIFELDPNDIRQYWSEITKGTPAEQAKLHFRLIPAELQCMVCFGKYHPIDQQTLCPICGSVGAKVLAGEECFVESIQTE